MKILDTRVYRGPNLYALRKVIRLKIDLGELEDYPTGKLPGFVEERRRLVIRLDRSVTRGARIEVPIERPRAGAGT